MARLVLLYLACLACVALGCVPPDCDNTDCGSCANACCILEFMFDLDADAVNKAMVDSLKKGGDDGRYTLVGDYDYRNESTKIGLKWQMQAIHTTKVHHYNDTLNFLVTSKTPGKTVVKGFSISQIAGAYCDDGQNYKNLVGYVKGLGVKFEQKPILGCPPPPPPPPKQ